MSWSSINPGKGGGGSSSGPGWQGGMFTGFNSGTPGGVQYPQVQPIGTVSTTSTTIPGNPLAQAGQYFTNTAYGVANSINPLLSAMTTGGMTDMEKKVFNQSVNTGKNQLAGQYEGMPGHSSFDQQFGGVVGQAMNQTLANRYSLIPQYSQTLLGAAGLPYQTGMNAYSQGANISNSSIGSLASLFNGMPYNAPAYQSGGGGGGKK